MPIKVPEDAKRDKIVQFRVMTSSYEELEKLARIEAPELSPNEFARVIVARYVKDNIGRVKPAKELFD